MADLDQLEELILAIERAYLPLPGLASRIAAAEQSLAMWWTTLGYAAPPPAPTINHIPTINVPAAQIACATGASYNVSLTGITDGDGATQIVTITATSNNTGVIPNPTITYTNPNTTGTLTYTPVVNLTAGITLTVKVQDNGGTALGGVDTKLISFGVTVVSPLVTPSLNTFPNIGPFAAGGANRVVSANGIGPGSAQATGFMALSATSSNPAVAGIVGTSYTNPSTSGTITISPLAAGSSTITVTATDTNGARCGTNNTIVRTFTFGVI